MSVESGNLISPLEGKFEPEARAIVTNQSDAALVSIAVSLKRLADHLAGTAERSGLVDALYDTKRI
jgi:hypothetical protein